jgi:hypothetical protein
MSTTAIGASFSFASVRRIEASQPGRTREVEPVAAAQPTPTADTGPVARPERVSPSTLVSAQQQRGDDSGGAHAAARSYGS